MQAFTSFVRRFGVYVANVCAILAIALNLAAAPSVSITGPVQNELFIVPRGGSTNVTVSVVASSADRRIKQVQITVRKLPFLDIASFTLTNAPYTIVLTNLPEPGYHVRVAAIDDLGVSSALVTNSFRVGRFVTNDLFADRALLSSDEVRVIAGMDGATLEDGEPFELFFGSPYTAWWRWVAPVTGSYDLMTTGNEIDAFIGSSVAALQKVSTGYPLFLRNDRAYKRLFAQAGTEYAIRVGTSANYGPPPPEVSFAIAPTPAVSLIAPANDAVFHGTPDNPAVVEFSVAPLPSPRQVSAVYYYTLNSTVWDYDLTSPVVTSVFVLDAPFRITQTNIPPGNYFAYTVAVDEIGLGARSELRPFSVKDDTVLNDDFANSFPLQGSVVRFSANNINRSTTEARESFEFQAGSLWWRWVAPATGKYAVINRSAWVSKFDVYTGDSLDSLTRVLETNKTPDYFDATAGVTYHFRVVGYHYSGAAADLTILPAPTVSVTSPQPDARFPRGGNIRFEAAATSSQSQIRSIDFAVTQDANTLFVGTSTIPPFHLTWTNVPASAAPYFLTAFAHDSLGLSVTSSPVRFSVPTAPINDGFAHGINLTGAMVQGAASCVGATSEPGEPDPLSSQTLWWNWTAPKTGAFEATLFGNFGCAMHIFVGDTIALLTPVAGVTNDYPSAMARTVSFEANAGETYRIRLAPYPSTNVETRPLTYQIRPAGDIASPSVAIVSPENEQSFTVPIKLNIQAQAIAGYPLLENGFLDEAYIATIEFFANNQSIGRIFADSRRPEFTLVWTNRQTGRFLLTAKASDQNRSFSISDPIAVNFSLPQQIELRLAEIKTNRMRFAIAGPSDRIYSIRTSTNLVNWMVIATNVTSSAAIADYLDSNDISSTATFYQAIAE